jgi:hypothetical protein
MIGPKPTSRGEPQALRKRCPTTAGVPADPDSQARARARIPGRWENSFMKAKTLTRVLA